MSGRHGDVDPPHALTHSGLGYLALVGRQARAGVDYSGHSRARSATRTGGGRGPAFRTPAADGGSLHVAGDRARGNEAQLG